MFYGGTRTISIKVVTVNIDDNGTTMSISVTNGYSFYIGDVQYLDNSTYPN